MLLYYCLNCRKNTQSNHSKVVMTKNRRIMLLSNYAVYDSKEQETRVLLSSLGMKISLNEIPLWGPLLF